MKVLSDKEYEDLLKERLLKVNAEIALVDEGIEALRAREREEGKNDGVGSAGEGHGGEVKEKREGKGEGDSMTK